MGDRGVAAATSRQGLVLVREEVLEPSRCQLRVPDRMPDILVAKIGLDRPRILASIRQRIARRVPQHVGMCLEWQAGPFAGALDYPVKAIAIERGAALIDEDEG